MTIDELKAQRVRPSPPKIPIRPIRPEPLEKCDRPGCENGCRCGLGLLVVLALLFVIGLGSLFLMEAG